MPPGGIGVVSFVYQGINNTNHRLTDGSLLDGYDSVSHGVLLNLDYAVTYRLSFSVGIPYVAVKYTGPEPSLFALPNDDCMCWSSGWQDFGVTARYSIANAAFALTPSVSFGTPSHNYEYFGEAVLGRNLNEVRIGVDAGQRLDGVSDRLSVSARYTFALVEQVLDLQNNRSNMALEASFQAARKLGTRVVFAWQRSHGGLRSTEIDTDEEDAQYDRILKDNNFHLGGGVSYTLPRSTCLRPTPSTGRD